MGQRTPAPVRASRRLAADVAPRVTAAALHEAEQRYRRVISRSASPIVVFDARDGTVLDANRPASKLFGYGQREFIGLNRKTPGPAAALWRGYVRAVARHGAPGKVDFIRRRPDGTVMLVSSRTTPLAYHGKPAVLGLLRDVTERHRLDAALRLSASRLRAARDASLDAFYLVESVRNARGRITDFRFVEVNRRGAALLSHRRRDLLGKHMCELMPFVRAQGIFEKFVRVVETKRAHVDVFPITVPAIRASWIHEHAVPVGDAIAIMSRDISGEMKVRHALRRLSWQTLEAQERERRRVARDLHDGVGQLLTAARFHLQAVDDHLEAAAPLAGGTRARSRRELAAANRSVAIALDEIRRIARRLRPGELDDLGFLAALRSLCRETAKRTGLRIVLRHKRLQHRPSRVVEEALYRIVQEGLTNVERHARARHVWIRLGQQRDRIGLEIRDDGRGFSARSIRSSSGAGLGNMQERATRAGGTFVRRSAPGRGTEVFVQLPLNPRASLEHDP